MTHPARRSGPLFIILLARRLLANLTGLSVSLAARHYLLLFLLDPALVLSDLALQLVSLQAGNAQFTHETRVFGALQFGSQALNLLRQRQFILLKVLDLFVALHHIGHGVIIETALHHGVAQALPRSWLRLPLIHFFPLLILLINLDFRH